MARQEAWYPDLTTMEEVLPTDPAAAAAASSSSTSQPDCEPEIVETADECHEENDVYNGGNAMEVNATVEKLSLSESCANEGKSDLLRSHVGPTPTSTLPKHKRRRKPRGGSKHTSISESSPIIDNPPELETISKHLEQKDEEPDHSDTILLTTTTTTPQQIQQPSKQKRSRRRKKVFNSMSDQQQLEKQQSEQHQQDEAQLEIHENDANDDDHNINEDEDDYPSSMGIAAAIEIEGTNHHDQQTNQMTSSRKEKKVPKRTIMEELTFLKRISSTRCQVDLGRYMCSFCYTVYLFRMPYLAFS